MTKNPTTKYPTLTVRLSQETIDGLRSEAEWWDVSVSEIIRQAIKVYYKCDHMPFDD